MINAGCQLRLGKAIWQNIGACNAEELMTFDPDTSVLAGVAIPRAPITRKVMEKAPNLRLIAKYTVGVDDVDMDAAIEKGILVAHCPTESNWGGVAEGVMAGMLAMLKKIREKDQCVKNGGWRNPSLTSTYLGRRFDGYTGITIGIIGLGRIGTRLADLLAPWRVRIIASDPYIHQSKFIRHNVECVDLETLLKTADVVTLHCNLTEETTRIIGAEQLAMMKENAILINAARGPMVDIDALSNALSKNRIAGAILDVLPHEPADPALPLLAMGHQVLLSPHNIAETFGGGLEPAIPWTTEAILASLRGIVPKNIYNQEAIPTWLQRFGSKNLL